MLRRITVPSSTLSAANSVVVPWVRSYPWPLSARSTFQRASGTRRLLGHPSDQSGESHRVGRISLCGDEAMRALLYEAAQVMLARVQKWSWLKAWAMNIAKRRGQKKAIVALARRLAVIMHRMWSDGTEFRWTREMAPTI